MRRLRTAWIAVAMTVSFCGVGGAEPSYVRVATFNIAKFGEGDEHQRSLVGLVNILMAADADLVCLQEIRPGQMGYEQVERLVKLLNKASEFYKKPPYSFSVAHQYVGDEAPGYLWRTPVKLLSEVGMLNVPEDPDGDGKRTFQRVPGLAWFKAGNFDFYAVNVHLYTQVNGKSSEGRGEELAAIAQWLRELSKGPERDAIVLGDFNRFLNGKSPWKQFLSPGYEKSYRVPLLESIRAMAPHFDPAEDDAPAEQFSTTASRKLSIYDQVVLASGTYREYVASPRFGVDVGIVNFDQDPHYEWFVRDWDAVSEILSDHKPVWVRLRTDLEDDD